MSSCNRRGRSSPPMNTDPRGKVVSLRLLRGGTVALGEFPELIGQSVTAHISLGVNCSVNSLNKHANAFSGKPHSLAQPGPLILASFQHTCTIRSHPSVNSGDKPGHNSYRSTRDNPCAMHVFALAPSPSTSPCGSTCVAGFRCVVVFLVGDLTSRQSRP